MESKVLEKVISILEVAEEFYVPLKKLWKDLQREEYKLPIYEDFLAELCWDERFELKDFGAPWDEDEEEDMEELGYYSGPRVKLKSREITKKDMQRITLRHAQNTINNLIEAYKARPQDLPPEAEDELIELMRKSKELKEKIDTLFHK